MARLNQPAVAACLSFCLLAGCSGREEFPNRPITIICPWSEGGGTDRVSRQVALFLDAELDTPVNVVNATGGRGVRGHRAGLKAPPDGYTIAMTTVELNMLHWQGLTNLTWEDAEPLLSINEDAAAVFVPAEAPWRNMRELQAAIEQEPGKLTASGTATGGIWHLALAGWLEAAGLQATDVNWIPMSGAGPSLKELAGGGLNIVCCSLPEAQTDWEAGRVRCLGVMAPERVAGYPDVPTLIEQGTDWTTVGWRGLAVPVGTPPERVAVLTAALEKIVRGETRVGGKTFPEFMAAQRFNNRFRGPEEFREFLKTNDEKYGRILSSPAFASLSTPGVGPWVFPALLGVGLALAVGTQMWRRRLAPVAVEAGGGRQLPVASRPGWLNALAVVAFPVLYLLLAPTAGFVLTVGGLLLALLLLFQTRPLTAALVSLLLTPAVYSVFVHGLRVTLPRGWLGW